MKIRFKTRFTYILLTTALVSSCGSTNTTQEFAEKFIAAEDKAWSTGNLDSLKALEDNGVVYHMPGAEVKGWKGHEEFIVQGRPTVSNLKQNWQYLSGEGNHFALAYNSTAILNGDSKTPAAVTSNNYLFFFRLKDAKVAEVWVNGSATNTPVKATN